MSVNELNHIYSIIDKSLAQYITNFESFSKAVIYTSINLNKILVQAELSKHEKDAIQIVNNIIFQLNSDLIRRNLTFSNIRDRLNSALKEISSRGEDPRKLFNWIYLYYEGVHKDSYAKAVREILKGDSYEKLIKLSVETKLTKNTYSILSNLFDQHSSRKILLTFFLFISNPKLFAPISGELVRCNYLNIRETIPWALWVLTKDFIRFSDFKALDWYLYYTSSIFLASTSAGYSILETIIRIKKCVESKYYDSCAGKIIDDIRVPSDIPSYEYLRKISFNDFIGILASRIKDSGRSTGISDLFINSDTNCASVQEYINRIFEHRTLNIIFYGPPGVGKTLLAKTLSECITPEEKEFVTFHQSYSYEEFIEGIRPEIIRKAEHGTISFNVEDGIFKKLSIKAMHKLFSKLMQYEDFKFLSSYILESRENQENTTEIFDIQKILHEFRKRSKVKPEISEKVWELIARREIPLYVMVIDEINRGDISHIFGELITLLEYDKRLFMPNQLIVTLPYSGELFAVPPNLILIGTMNSADRSIALVDYALRRRFTFINLRPDPEKIKQSINGINLKVLLEKLNDVLKRELDEDHLIGHSYFMKDDKPINSREELQNILCYQIIPLLKEYFYGRLNEDLKSRLMGDSELFDKCTELEIDEFMEKIKKLLEVNSASEQRS